MGKRKPSLDDVIEDAIGRWDKETPNWHETNKRRYLENVKKAKRKK